VNVSNGLNEPTIYNHFENNGAQNLSNGHIQFNSNNVPDNYVNYQFKNVVPQGNYQNYQGKKTTVNGIPPHHPHVHMIGTNNPVNTVNQVNNIQNGNINLYPPQPLQNNGFIPYQNIPKWKVRPVNTIFGNNPVNTVNQVNNIQNGNINLYPPQQSNSPTYPGPNNDISLRNQNAINNLTVMGFSHNDVISCIRESRLNVMVDLISEELIMDTILSKNSNIIEANVDKSNTTQVKVEVKTEEEDKKDRCIVCFENEINTVCVPCGHLCLCFPCVSKLQGNECPVCRKTTSLIIRTYKI